MNELALELTRIYIESKKTTLFTKEGIFKNIGNYIILSIIDFHII